MSVVNAVIKRGICLHNHSDANHVAIGGSKRGDCTKQCKFTEATRQGSKHYSVVISEIQNLCRISITTDLSVCPSHIVKCYCASFPVRAHSSPTFCQQFAESQVIRPNAASWSETIGRENFRRGATFNLSTVGV